MHLVKYKGLSDTYDADSLVGASLYALKDIPLVYLPYDNSQPFRVVPAGGLVGVIESYLSPAAGRDSVYWMFYDDNGKPYYAKHREGIYSQTDLNVQYNEYGEQVKSNEQIKAEQDAANASTWDKIYSAGKSLAIYGGLLYLAGTLIKSRSK